MERYLFINELPVILTRPGLLVDKVVHKVQVEPRADEYSETKADIDITKDDADTFVFERKDEEWLTEEEGLSVLATPKKGKQIALEEGKDYTRDGTKITIDEGNVPAGITAFEIWEGNSKRVTGNLDEPTTGAKTPGGEDVVVAAVSGPDPTGQVASEAVEKTYSKGGELKDKASLGTITQGQDLVLGRDTSVVGKWDKDNTELFYRDGSKGKRTPLEYGKDYQISPDGATLTVLGARTAAFAQGPGSELRIKTKKDVLTNKPNVDLTFGVAEAPATAPAAAGAAVQDPDAANPQMAASSARKAKDPNYQPLSDTSNSPNQRNSDKISGRLDRYESKTEASMAEVFGEFWGSGKDFNQVDVGNMVGDLQQKLKDAKEAKQYYQQQGNDTAAAAAQKDITYLEDKLARAQNLRDVAGDYQGARQALANGDWETGRDFIYEHDQPLKELGGKTQTEAWLDTGRFIEDIEPVVAARSEAAPGQAGAQGARMSKFEKFMDGMGKGAAVGQAFGDLAGRWNYTKESVHELTGAHGPHGMFGPGGIGNRGFGAYGGFPGGFGVYNQGFGGYGGYGGFSGGFNSGAGSFGGGFNLAMGGFGGGFGMNDTREQDRKLSMIINMLLFAVAAGNTDAITTALTLIARQGKESLRRVATSALVALQSYERQQSMITDTMQNLNAESPNYASQLQSLSGRMGMYSSNRQMIVSLLRDVKSMVDELENMSKSYQDTSLQHQRRQMIFA